SEPRKHWGERADSAGRRGDLRVGAARIEIARVRGGPSLGAARSRRTPLSSSARARSQAGMTSLSHAGSRGRLLPILGIGFGLAVTVGNAIGAGILRAPGEVAGHLPLVWLYIAVWVVGGLYALLGALQLAELGAMIPRSGGQYVFARYALGEYPGFIVGWSDWLSTCGSAAAVSLVIGEFAGALFPALHGRDVVTATTIAILFAALQWHGIVWGSAVQNLTSVLKTL